MAWCWCLLPMPCCPVASSLTALHPTRYLLPCSHVMLSQKRAVRDLDIYGKTAAKFLSLIPRCCRPENVPLPERDEEHTAWAKGTASALQVHTVPHPRSHTAEHRLLSIGQSSPSVDASSAAPVPRPSTPSRLAFFMRQQSGGPEAAGTAPRSPGTPSGSPAHRATRWEEVAELDRN